MSRRFKIIPKSSDKDIYEKCLACNGSGYYDHNGSPPCWSCEGTGKTLKHSSD